MRHTRLISAAVGALFVTASVTGCSSSDVKNAAKSKANELKASATAKAGELAKSKAGELSNGQLGDIAKQKAGDLVKKLSPENQKKLDSALKAAGLSLPSEGANAAKGGASKAASNPAAQVAADFFAARQAALKSGDVSLLKQLTGPKKFKQVRRYVKNHQGQAPKKFQVKVVSVKGNKSNVCVGPKAKAPKTVALNKQGKVMAIRPGTFSC